MAKKRMSLELRIALDKLAATKEGKDLDKELYTTVTSYSPVDKVAAKDVLDRLLNASTRREVSYIKVVPIEVEES